MQAGTKASAKDMTVEKAKWVYKKMQEIRQFENTVHGIFEKGEIPGFVHLYAGEEAVAVGVCAHLTDSDSITSTHRGHGHCIAKGCDLDGMMAEIFGRSTGLCKGKGGSMHIADVSKGMLGANGIVGAGLPLSIGAGLTAKVKKTDNVAVCFFGDGASNHGTFHEAINIAAIWKLPVIFVNENNGFGEASTFDYASACDRVSDFAKVYKIAGETVDGRDVQAVYKAAGKAVERARSGKGPTILECLTYRDYGHFEGDTQTYKNKEVQERALNEDDPIRIFEEHAKSSKLLSEKEIKDIGAEVKAEIDHAVKFAESSPFPDASQLTTDVYVSY
ncbi:thiamine pyrophosphate-dependent dehydrogenase E1 component subunit alpha [Sporolactobacillus sp. Y61]|jgi:pyruvate dehydrogenase E1 component alpha subunit|uniref:Thiamine pyrophosphate-dependent dehydrogenase E1 component subunit alpha n=1 Tax=Sporolactobacillus sp. Y61 TaxID=3160863 RepID=A0AAU8IDJ1_9BACL|nr:thiamine pyrophosphate-dependent dehydrogenase E1 component subunit alpha [Sporolactobacillus sp. THM19-2]RYL93167.1 thiamine pyrophosphate-dependent dehydrogenase E1 component subunit alpha [Sporolactobacillus sp. THM19-2]